MSRAKGINVNEVDLWLAVLLDTAFDPATGAVDNEGRLQLLGLASDFTQYPDDIPPARRAERLIFWAAAYLPPEWWPRLQARVRKRRSAAA